jgi:hypothetical protein
MADAYVLGTFGDALEFLEDFNGNPILVSLTGATQDSQTILDRDSECGITDEIFLVPAESAKAAAFAADDNAVLLQVQCGLPLDCPELDRSLIVSHGCNPPPNCILEPEALIAAIQKPDCMLPTFFPPHSPHTDLVRGIDLGFAEASAVAYDISFESVNVLTNYIEMPFFQAWLFYPSELIGPKFLQYRGIVRLWESGTVQLIGEATVNYTGGKDYKVWIGDSPTDVGGHDETVISVPGDSAWHAVDWAYLPPSGKVVHIRYDGNDPGVPAQVWSYADGGWTFPITFRCEGDGGSRLNGTATRSGTTFSVSGSLGASASFATGFGIYTYEQDSADWSNTNGVTHFVDSIPPTLTTAWGPYTHTIPDSATKGIRFLGELAGGTGGAYGYGARCDFGPVLLATHDPVIQQGVDPLG